MKVFAYLRVSDPSQIKGGGFDRQLKAINQYAAANKLQIAEVYQEEGVSGTLADRPTLARLLYTLEKNSHGVTTVIIEKMDRLARDIIVQEAIVRDFQAKGFTLISALEGKDLGSDDPSREAIRIMFGMIAQYEKRMLVLKLKASRERIKQQTGKCEGRKGYNESDKGRDIVKRIKLLRRKQKYNKQRTWQQIADILNEEGTLTLEGKKWTFQRVQQTVK